MSIVVVPVLFLLLVAFFVFSVCVAVKIVYSAKRSRESQADPRSKRNSAGSFNNELFHKPELNDAEPIDESPIDNLRFAPRNIMTPTELKFFLTLQEAVGSSLLVFTKVGLWAVVRNLEYAGWSRISQKHLDFVLCYPQNGNVYLAIELDDPSHLTSDGRRRDAAKNAILASAGVPLLRIQAAPRYDVYELREQIFSKSKG